MVRWAFLTRTAFNRWVFLIILDWDWKFMMCHPFKATRWEMWPLRKFHVVVAVAVIAVNHLLRNSNPPKTFFHPRKFSDHEKQLRPAINFSSTIHFRISLKTCHDKEAAVAFLVNGCASDTFLLPMAPKSSLQYFFLSLTFCQSPKIQILISSIGCLHTTSFFSRDGNTIVLVSLPQTNIVEHLGMSNTTATTHRP